MSNIGVTFRETMSGGFALGAVDPAEGLARGRREGSELALNAEVIVPDVDAFVADSSHGGQLKGSVELTGWGAAITGSNGVFNLFKPGDEPSLRLMVYELAFERDGTPYYLAGQKIVHDEFLEIWNQTTTLYTRLHKGKDKTGPVAGAGTINVSVAGLIGVVSSLHATGTDSKKDAAAAVSKFGRFFMGQLWDSYVRHQPAS